MPLFETESLVLKSYNLSEADRIVLFFTREHGIVQGERTSSTAMPQISLTCLSKTATLTPGQKIHTSGVGGVFPSGVLVGSVREF